MSVLMTAGKNAWKRQSSKTKKKKHRTSTHPRGLLDSTPPPSNDSTTVWYWLLDDVPTTLMYNQEELEVWCNGQVIQATPTSVSGSFALDFTICVDATQSLIHDARIICGQSVADAPAVNCLYVDGVPIMEHSLHGARRAGAQLSPEVAPVVGAQALPSYEEATEQVPAYQEDDEVDSSNDASTSDMSSDAAATYWDLVRQNVMKTHEKID